MSSRKTMARKQRAEVDKLLQRGKTFAEIADAIQVSRQRVHAVIENIERSGVSLHSGTLDWCDSGPYEISNHIGKTCRYFRVERELDMIEVVNRSGSVFSLPELSKFERGLCGMSSRKLNRLLKVLRVSLCDVWPDNYDSPEDLATWLSVTVDELIDMVMFVTKLRR